MDRFRSGKSLSPLRQAEAYWTDLCDGAQVPLRSQIDPRGLENLLHDTFILERIAPGIARFRLAGQNLHELAGMEVRGMPISAFFCAASRGEIGAVLEAAFDGPSIAELTLTGEGPRQGGTGEGRMILLPLRSEDGTVDRLLGVLVADHVATDGPVRFRVTRSALRPVNGQAVAPAPRQVAGFAEPQARMEGQIPYLRLVE